VKAQRSPETSKLPEPGETIAGKYEVVRLLGRGGMGIVVEALHRKLDQRFAIKLLLPEALSRSDAVARFEREARASARLRSPYAVRVHDVDNDASRGGLPFIVMEYLEGHDLSKELRERGTLPVSEAVDIALQVCLAMSEAHARGIVHRDLKPGNLFLSRQDDRRVVKVMDFGISKLVLDPAEADLTTTETALGTPRYMAPEQVVSSKSIDHRIDIWAVGVILYRVLTGTFPFSGDNPTELAVAIATQRPTPILERKPDLPPALADAIMSALSRDRERRPADALAFATMLEPFGTGQVQLAPVLPSAPLPVMPRLPAPHESTATVTSSEQDSGATVVTGPPSAVTLPRRLVMGILGAALLAATILVAIRAVRPPEGTMAQAPSATQAATASNVPPSAPAPASIPSSASAPTASVEEAGSAAVSASFSAPAPAVSAPAPTQRSTPTKRPPASPPTASASSAPTENPLHL
jgi:serine/threonine-protein kinase